MRPGIDPKVDYAFKRLFGRERNLPPLRHLFHAVLKPPPADRLTDLQLLNPFSDQDALDDKLSVVDVKARDASGRLLHIEMQVLPERAFRSRVLYYWAELHRQQLQAGDPYLLLRPTISICLTDFVLFPEVPDYCLPFQVVNRTHGLVFAPDLLLVMLELPKFQRRLRRCRIPWTYGCTFFGMRKSWTASSCRPPWTWPRFIKLWRN